MKNRFSTVCILLFVNIWVFAQFGNQQQPGFNDPNAPNNNPYGNPQINNQAPDTSDYKPDTTKKKKEPFVWKNNPKVATLLSMAVPGSGQIYNKKYWKAPIVWVFMGAAATYFYISNQQYQDYRRVYYLTQGYSIDELSNNPLINQTPNKLVYDKNYYNYLNQQYADIQDNKYVFGFGNSLPENNSVTGYLFYHGNPDSSRFASRMAFYRDDARRQRDIAAVAFLFGYILNMMDAAVDAHFSKYRVGDDISMKIRPDFITPSGLPYWGIYTQFTFVSPRKKKYIY
ncbi:MAG: DUF5683 domain-containing protein [Bacteroidota bacterium]|nr:DUF5683 domain-containing protein [Bacteroidota bacterium]